MSIEIITKVLAWCTTINLCLLIFWFIFFTAAHDWIYRVHNKWYKVSADQFNTIHYSAMVFYKIVFLVFNLIPYLALMIVL
jgi:hypothetical protein